MRNNLPKCVIVLQRFSAGRALIGGGTVHAHTRQASVQNSALASDVLPPHLKLGTDREKKRAASCKPRSGTLSQNGYGAIYWTSLADIEDKIMDTYICKIHRNVRTQVGPKVGLLAKKHDGASVAKRFVRVWRLKSAVVFPNLTFAQNGRLADFA
jgi:hypothetical protein